jgi:hypothetical protein
VDLVEECGGAVRDEEFDTDIGLQPRYIVLIWAGIRTLDNYIRPDHLSEINIGHQNGSKPENGQNFPVLATYLGSARDALIPSTDACIF